MLTWFLEIFPIIIGAPLLYVTYEKFRFSSIVYFFVLIHFVILAVGSIYTYAEVPLGFWMQDWFGFERNNYDKIGHFAQGFVPALIARELLLRTSTLTRGKWLNFIARSFFRSISWYPRIRMGYPI
jgi:putative membrane protein